MFDKYASNPKLSFADPGKERQDSVESGFRGCSNSAALIAIHDAARPLVTPEEIANVVSDAREHGAAVLGVPVKATIKESEDGAFVLRTVDRSRLWEVHTPQVIKPALLSEGFKRVKQDNLEVTDDVSIIEQIGEPVRLSERGFSREEKGGAPNEVTSLGETDARRVHQPQGDHPGRHDHRHPDPRQTSGRLMTRSVQKRSGKTFPWGHAPLDLCPRFSRCLSSPRLFSEPF